MGPVDVRSHHIINGPRLLLCNLTWLGVDDIDIGDDGIRSLVSTLSSGAFARLEQFSAVGNRIGDDGVTDLCWAAEQGYLSGLLHLNLGSNVVSDRGCASLAASLAAGAFPQLLHFSLARNRVGDDGLAAISDASFADGFVARPTYIGLGANLIGNPGTVALSRAIAFGAGLSSLQGVWVADNHRITDTGAVALANAIGQSPRFTEIFVYGTNMKSTGIDAFITALQKLPELRKAVIGRVTPPEYDLLDILQSKLRRDRSRGDLVIACWHHHEGVLPSENPRGPPRVVIPRGNGMRSGLVDQRGGTLRAVNHMGGINHPPQRFPPFGNLNVEGLGWM